MSTTTSCLAALEAALADLSLQNEAVRNENQVLTDQIQTLQETATLNQEATALAQQQLDQARQEASRRSQTPAPTTGSHEYEAKISAPEHYSGERSKLTGFLTQLLLVFCLQPSCYPTDSIKINYAASFLRGTPLRWIQPYLTAKTEPGLLRNYDLFCKELCQNFGDPDELATAERSIMNLKQKGSAASYATEFKHLATILGWDSSFLGAIFYRGLKDSVKDEITRIGRPSDYHVLIDKAITLDNRIHERNLEKGFSLPSSTPRFNRLSPPLSTGPSPSQDTKRSHNSSDLLTKSGKLVPHEYERRIKNNLCVYCGDFKHKVEQCPLKKSRPAVSAKAATTSLQQNEKSSQSGNA